MLPTNCGSTRGRVAAKRPGGVRCLLNHCIAFFATGLLVLPQAVHAEYPDRPIRIVSPWPAGGSGDLVARVFADFLARKTGASVVVENRTGGNGGIGSTAVARAAPDGYTLLVTTSEPLTINPTVSGDLQYVVARDFDPLGLIARTHFVVVAQAAFAPNDMQQLIANARANPGKVTAATYGIASLFVPYFESLTGTQFLKVPFHDRGDFDGRPRARKSKAAWREQRHTCQVAAGDPPIRGSGPCRVSHRQLDWTARPARDCARSPSMAGECHAIDCRVS